MEKLAGEVWLDSARWRAALPKKVQQEPIIATNGESPDRVDKLGVTGSSPVPPILSRPAERTHAPA